MWVVILAFVMAQDGADLSRLVQQLDDDDLQVRAQAAQKILDAGDKAVPVLKRYADDSSPQIRAETRRLLGDIVKKDSRATLLMQVGLQPWTREMAEALEKCGPEIDAFLKAQAGATEAEKQAPALVDEFEKTSKTWHENFDALQDEEDLDKRKGLVDSLEAGERLIEDIIFKVTEALGNDARDVTSAAKALGGKLKKWAEQYPSVALSNLDSLVPLASERAVLAREERKAKSSLLRLDALIIVKQYGEVQRKLLTPKEGWCGEHPVGWSKMTQEQRTQFEKDYEAQRALVKEGDPDLFRRAAMAGLKPELARRCVGALGKRSRAEQKKILLYLADHPSMQPEFVELTLALAEKGEVDIIAKLHEEDDRQAVRTTLRKLTQGFSFTDRSGAEMCKRLARASGIKFDAGDVADVKMSYDGQVSIETLLSDLGKKYGFTVQIEPGHVSLRKSK